MTMKHMNLHLNFVIIVVCVNHKIRMYRHRSKFVRGEYEEYVRGRLLEHFVQPNVLKRYGRLQQVDNDACEINVAHNHYVELTKQLKFLQVYCRFAIGGWRFLQMANRPNNRKQNCTATNQIDQNKYVGPGSSFDVTLFTFLDDDFGSVGQNLYKKKPYNFPLNIGILR